MTTAYHLIEITHVLQYFNITTLVALTAIHTNSSFKDIPCFGFFVVK